MPESSKGGNLVNDTMAFIAPFEKPQFRIYNDNGKPAIGFGHNITSREIKEGKVGPLKLVRDSKAPFGIRVEGEVTQKAVQQLFKADVQESIAAAQNVLPGVASKNMTVGLASFLYNVGPNKADAANNPKLAEAVASGNPSAIVDTLLRFSNVRNPETGRLEFNDGIMKRRELEASRIATPDGAEGLLEMLPGADVGFAMGATGVAAMQQELEQDPSMRRAMESVRANPVGLPGPTQNAIMPAPSVPQGITRAAQGGVDKIRNIK